MDGKYWIRVEYWSLEAGNEANAEVTFYVCSETGTICATKLADTNCNGQLDPGIDQPIPGWWICLTTPLGDDYCQQTDANGQACWSGIPLGDYTVYEVPAGGLGADRADDYNVTLVDGTPQSFTFLNRNLADCYHACCLPDGSCVVLLQTDCEAQGGIWQVVADLCRRHLPAAAGRLLPAERLLPVRDGCGVPDPGWPVARLRQRLRAEQSCPQPPGACCFPDGTCTYVLDVECQAAGGQWQGYGTVCTPNNPCLQPPGACCFPDGHCQLELETACAAAGGQWLGFGSVCTPSNPCPQPPGACCFPNGTCTYVLDAECAGGGWSLARVRQLAARRTIRARSRPVPAASPTVTASSWWRPLARPRVASGSDSAASACRQPVSAAPGRLLRPCDGQLRGHDPGRLPVRLAGRRRAVRRADLPAAAAGGCVLRSRHGRLHDHDPGGVPVRLARCRRAVRRRDLPAAAAGGCLLRSRDGRLHDHDPGCVPVRLARCRRAVRRADLPAAAAGGCVLRSRHGRLHDHDPGCVRSSTGSAPACRATPRPARRRRRTGACCDHATGACTITTQAACQFDWLGAGVPCNATTCVPPIPIERSSWGQIKNIYR